MEELHASSAFRDWFLDAVEVVREPPHDLIDVQHSVSDATGESDIELGIDVRGLRILVLIENKIDAVFQDDQLERYHTRGEARVDETWDEYRTCLVAPARYLGGTAQTDVADAVVSY